MGAFVRSSVGDLTHSLNYFAAVMGQLTLVRGCKITQMSMGPSPLGRRHGRFRLAALSGDFLAAPISCRASRLLTVLLAGSLSAACATSTPTATTTHGKLTEMSIVEGDIVFCSHKVPESVCTKHHPKLAAEFQRAGDWCPPHQVPESQCFECHPDLTFEPLPRLEPGADVVWLSKKGEDVSNLEAYAAKGKITVFDFYADWCATCRKIDGHIYKRIARGDKTIAYRKINIVSWESPVGQRYMKDVPSLPLLLIHGRDGKFIKSLHGSDTAALDAAISEAQGAK